jgi:hypothetical protein
MQFIFAILIIFSIYAFASFLYSKLTSGPAFPTSAYKKTIEKLHNDISRTFNSMLTRHQLLLKENRNSLYTYNLTPTVAELISEALDNYYSGKPLLYSYKNFLMNMIGERRVFLNADKKGVHFLPFNESIRIIRHILLLNLLKAHEPKHSQHSLECFHEALQKVVKNEYVGDFYVAPYLKELENYIVEIKNRGRI